MVKILRQNYRMSYDLLISRITERLKALGMSERKACLTADVGLNSIRHIRVRGHAPKPETLAKLANVLEVPASYFLEAAAEGHEKSKDPIEPNKSHFASVEKVYVKGFVQAGAWQDALEWPMTDWMSVYIPPDPRYMNVARFGLEVRGDSMNKVYPEGSIVIAVRLDDLGRLPRNGERVVVLSRCTNGNSAMEATIKKYQIDTQGRHILWPESTDPLYQTPIILDDRAKSLGIDGHDADHGASCDIEIYAVIIGSYRPE